MFVTCTANQSQKRVKKQYIYKQFLNRFILPIGDKLLGSYYLSSLKQWQLYDQMSLSQHKELEKKALLRILNHAKKTVPFYKNKIPKQLNYNDVFDKIQELPILTKELLNSERDNLLSNKYSKGNLIKNFSSGSTGQQSYSYSLKNEKFKLQAIQRHWFRWTGYEDGDSVLQFGISPNRGFLKKAKDVFFNVHYFSAFSLSEKDFQEIFEVLKKNNITYIIGYPSAIYELSKWMNKNNLEHKINAIISLGDKLFNHYESSFNVTFLSPKILDTYGCAEGFLIAAKYDIKYYYISSPHVYIEIVNDKGELIQDGNIGHILVTGLTNYAQPFIRYKLGDMGVKLPDKNYPAKSYFNYPLLKKIVGRENEVIVTPNNIKLVVHSFTGIFEYYPQIKQFKIIQMKKDYLVVEYISNHEIENNALKTLKGKLVEITNNTMHINFKRVNNIVDYKSGKPQIVEVKTYK